MEICTTIIFNNIELDFIQWVNYNCPKKVDMFKTRQGENIK